MTHRPPSPFLRALSLGAFAIATAYLLTVEQPPSQVAGFYANWDKLIHAGFYAILATLLWTGVGGHSPGAVWTLIAIIGGLDEVRQAFLPGRTCDALDFAADALGAAAALLVLHVNSGRSPCVESSAPSRAATLSRSSSRA